MVPESPGVTRADRTVENAVQLAELPRNRSQMSRRMTRTREMRPMRLAPQKLNKLNMLRGPMSFHGDLRLSIRINTESEMSTALQGPKLTRTATQPARPH